MSQSYTHIVEHIKLSYCQNFDVVLYLIALIIDLQRKIWMCFRGSSGRSLFRLRHRNLLGTIRYPHEQGFWEQSLEKVWLGGGSEQGYSSNISSSTSKSKALRNAGHLCRPNEVRAIESMHSASLVGNTTVIEKNYC